MTKNSYALIDATVTELQVKLLDNLDGRLREHRSRSLLRSFELEILTYTFADAHPLFRKYESQIGYFNVQIV